jgi:hypothetical protein
VCAATRDESGKSGFLLDRRALFEAFAASASNFGNAYR